MTDLNDNQKSTPPAEPATVNNVKPSKKKNSFIVGGIVAAFLVFLLGFGLGFTSGALTFGHHNDKQHSRSFENHRSGERNQDGPRYWNNDNNNNQSRPAPDKMNKNNDSQKQGTKENQSSKDTKSQAPKEGNN